MLLDRDQSLLLVIDMQERLMPAIADGEACLARARLLLQIAGLLEVPTLVSEQYPRGLGHSISALLPWPPGTRVLEKASFSCGRNAGLRAAISATGRRQLLLCGVETHVCVLQTAIDFLARGFEIFVAADASGSRDALRRELGLERMRQEGVRIVHTEMAAFEWLGEAGTDTFRRVVPLLK